MLIWKYLNKNQRGWILIDGLIATVIVAIALTALAMAYRQSTVVSISAENYSKAVYLAQSTIENLKQNDLDLTKTVPATVTEMETIPPSIYKFSITPFAVSEIQYIISSSLVPIRVIVSWTESGAPRSVAITSYYISPLTAGNLQ